MYTWVCSPALLEALGDGSVRCALPRPVAQGPRKHASLRRVIGETRECTWPPTKPAFSLGMLVCVSISVVKLAFESFSLLLNNFSSCQGKSLCLEGTRVSPRWIRKFAWACRLLNQLACRLPFSNSKSYGSRLTCRPER